MKNASNILTLSIAGFSIQLLSEHAIEPEYGYEPFLIEKTDQPDVTVECFAGIPSNPFNAEPVFKAENASQKFYSVFKTDAGLGFLIYNQQTKDEIQQVAYLDETYSHWKVYSEFVDNKLMPLDYPFGPILMHYMTLKNDAVMMHASCAFDGSKGRLFSGFSGAGKSTMSKIWSEAGNRIINDDRLIIRKENGSYWVYNTPMYYNDMPKKAPLSAVYLISHSPVNIAKKISGALAVSKVMAFSIQNNFEKELIAGRLNLFSDICSKVPVYDLGFVPNKTVVDYILDNESKETK